MQILQLDLCTILTRQEMPKLNFVTLSDNNNYPIPAIKALPEWYKSAKKYFSDGESTYKNCIPFFEGIYSGYVMLTPCDIEFYVDNNIPKFKIDKEYDFFISSRPPMLDFKTPFGYHEDHFAWKPQWGVESPQGYNVLYTTPFNGYDVPFLNTSGIINNDKTSHPGNIPFFLRKEFSGVIKAGTPFLQVIPIKRENWNSANKVLDPETIDHFKPGTPRIQNHYRKAIWERTRYE